MHPSRFPFVQAGPLCVCGHSRVAHVGVNSVLGGVSHDVGCSDCECTSYRRVNAGTPEAEAAAMRDVTTYAVIVSDEARRRVRYLTGLRLAMFAAGLCMVMSVVFPVSNWEFLGFALIGVLGCIFFALAVSERRVGEVGMARVNTVQGALAFMVAGTLWLSGPLWIFCVVASFAFAAILLHVRSSNRFIRNAFRELERYRPPGGFKS